MSLTLYCNHCGKPLSEPGALVFGPPTKTCGTLWTSKWHICVECWKPLLKWIDPERGQRRRNKMHSCE